MSTCALPFLRVSERRRSERSTWLARRGVTWPSQQAAGKALKALLLLESGRYEPTLDLHDLVDLLRAQLAERIPRAGLSPLTKLYIEARYPDRYAEATSAEAGTEVVAAWAAFEVVNSEFRIVALHLSGSLTEALLVEEKQSDSLDRQRSLSC